MTVADIDLNVRCGPNDSLTYVGFEDVDGEFAISDWIEVRELESGVVGKGCVVEIDVDKELVYILVKWHDLRVT